MRLLLTILFFGNVLTSPAQEGNVGVTNLFKVTAVNPGIAVERRVSRFQTLYMHGYAATSLGVGFSSSQGTTAFIAVDPALNLQYRFYYNGQKRSEKGKSTSNNSMNYVALSVDCILTSESIYQQYQVNPDRRPVFQQAVLVGMQRSYPKRFNVDLSVGPAVYFTKVRQQDASNRLSEKWQFGFVLDLHLTIGWWLNRR